jgi:hypothetical protein
VGWKKLAKTEKGEWIRSNVKAMLTAFFFDIEGVVHHEFLCQGQTVFHWYYLEDRKSVV